jgi:hypothetical protein
VLATLTWLAVLAGRFAGFNERAAGFDAVAAKVPEGADVFALVADADAPPLPGTPFLHFAALLQVERSLLMEPSFSRNFPQLILYRTGARKRLTAGLRGGSPQPDHVARELANHPYTHVLVRSRVDPVSRFPALGTTRWRVLAEHGDWWLFRSE